MQGKLYRRPGSLLYWFGYTDDRGFPVEHCTGTYDYAEAEIIAAQIGGPSRDQTSTATHARKAGAILIAECIARYVDAARLDLSPATVECYEQKGGHLVRLLGDLYLSKLSLDHVATYCKVRLQEGAARESVRKELVVLRLSLTHAKDRGVLEKDPASLIPKFRAKYKPKRRWLSAQELRALLRQLACSARS